jgi:GMP synthase-like glutamine amidotransferase
VKPALVVQHGPLGPPGILGEWLAERGIDAVVHRADENHVPWPDVRDHAFVAVLGSRFNPTDDEKAVTDTRAAVDAALEHDVPVLGLCFGGQMLAHALGAPIEDVPDGPELGWVEIDTVDAETVPGGPWLTWHWHRFHPPTGADVLATSRTGTQAFRHGPHLGVQFHPESTIEIVAGWARADRERLTGIGVADGEALLEEGRRHAETAARNARRLFDGFLEGAGQWRGELDGAP